jgi:hypothetical protein
MHIERDSQGDLILTLEDKEAEELGDHIIDNARQLPRSVLDLGYLARQGRYALRDNFRQPPHAFDSEAPKQPSVEG